jgi:hypothetical protein
MRSLRYVFALSGIAILALSLCGFLLRDRVHSQLADWTGEYGYKHQLISLFSPLFERSVDTDDMAPMTHRDVNPYGMNTFFEQEVEEWKLRRSMEMLRDAGAHWVRQQIPWRDIEIPAKGQYVDKYGQSTWEKYDRIVALTQEYGLEIMARLDAPPDWSRSDNSVSQRPPDRLSDWGDFVYTFVSRYKGKVRYYQLWNEPNIYPEWGNQPVDAAAFVELLKVGYARAKEADPSCVIVCAALAPTNGTPDGMNENEFDFLQKMYDAGARPYFDVMSAMGYGMDTGPRDRRTSETRLDFSRVRLLREVMVRNGDEGKSVWLSEVGWNVLPPDFPGPATHGRVSDEEQARYTEDAYKRAQAEWPWVGTMFFWHFRKVTDEERDRVEFYFRMVDPDFTPHPAYFSYARTALRPPALTKGYHQEDSWALRYSQGWKLERDDEAVLGQWAVARNAGDTLSFRMAGTKLWLVTRVGPAGGRLYVTIDGRPQRSNALPLDRGGHAYVGLRFPEERRVEVLLAQGLPPGSHDVSITVIDAGGGVAVDGLIVGRTRTTPVKPLLAGSAGIALLAVFAILAAWRARGRVGPAASGARD